MLISDTVGMGKSTLLTHLSKQIKLNFPAKWVVRIDLNDHTDALKELREKQIGKEKEIELLSEKVLKLKPGSEVKLYNQCYERKQKVKMVIMLDGFGEIHPTVTELLQALKQMAAEQLWVTTRPHLREELEDKLQQLSYARELFSENNQLEFLKEILSLQDRYNEGEGIVKEEDKII
jgi:hypothetical protein